MKIEHMREIDIKAYLVYIIAISCAWFGKIDWIVAILFILSNITLCYHLAKKDKGQGNDI